MESEAIALLVDAGARPDEITLTRTADMRHIGQGFEIPVAIPGGNLQDDSLSGVREAFFDSYHQLFERTVRDVPVEAMSWRLAATAPVPNISLNFSGQSSDEVEKLKGTRQVYFPETGFTDCSVYDRYALRAGDTLEGPAVIEERESTTVIGPGGAVTVDAYLNLICELP
jgi:N-methylhydantoinase A